MDKNSTQYKLKQHPDGSTLSVRQKRQVDNRWTAEEIQRRYTAAVIKRKGAWY